MPSSSHKVEHSAPRRARIAGLVVGAAALGAAAWPSIDRRLAVAHHGERLTALAAGDTAPAPSGRSAPGALCASSPAAAAVPGIGMGAGGSALASWQTVGGCGAGASSGTGAGVKWIGRNVTGGLFRVECQANYIDTAYGYNYVATTLVSAELTEKWTLGVSVPYLYKYMRNPYSLGFDVRNRGLGDVTGLITRNFGAINDTSVTLSLSAPTGTHDATLVRDKNIVLPQDRQLGLGKATASLTVDHVMDHISGVSVLGGLVSWRGGENELGSYRAPSATVYAYRSLLLGPFAPALGLQATGFTGPDKDRLQEMTSPLFNVALNASVEWATDWLALLVGASLPYQYDGETEGPMNTTRNPWGFGPWMVAVGVAFAPL